MDLRELHHSVPPGLNALFGLLFLVLPVTSWAADILYIGDSHSVFQANDGSRMGSLVARDLSQDQALAFYAACGSSPLTWVHGGRTTCGYREWNGQSLDSYRLRGAVPKFADLLSANEPATVIIEQGDNLFEWQKGPDGIKEASWPGASAERAISSLLAVLNSIAPQARCLWIGPTLGGNGPIYRKSGAALDALYASLQKTATPRCELIDSRSMIASYIGPDGLHLDGARSREWGEALVERLTHSQAEARDIVPEEPPSRLSMMRLLGRR